MEPDDNSQKIQSHKNWKFAIFYAFFCTLSIIICGYFISWFEPFYVWKYVDIQECIR